MLFIFDLDGTMIDSSHRKATLPDGQLDLAHWVENSTPEKVAKDTLLPLVSLWRFVQKDSFVIVCTARVMAKADLDFLQVNGLNFDAIVSRPAICKLPDSELKELGLRNLAGQLNYSWERFCESAIMYDDCHKVLARMRSIGIRCHDSKVLNG